MAVGGAEAWAAGRRGPRVYPASCAGRARRRACERRAAAAALLIQRPLEAPSNMAAETARETDDRRTPDASFSHACRWSRCE